MHKAFTVAEKERLAELVAAGTPLGEIAELIGRDRWTTRRNINYLGELAGAGTEAVVVAAQPG